jgi:glycerol-3-phosphate dehydrogenase
MLIIGGGIYGAALCWEASHRGIETLLIEQDDYASGASSNSLKTIHGGLRSLQSLNLKAVIKGMRERSVLMGISPNYIKPLACILPTTNKLMKSRVAVGAGLTLYNILYSFIKPIHGWKTKIPRASLFDLKELRRRTNDLFSYENFTGGAIWYDAQVQNTERFVLQFIKSACRGNATALNHVKAQKLESDTSSSNDRLLIQDQLTGQTKRVSAKVIVDCSSAWNFSPSECDNQKTDGSVRYIRAVNIIISKKLFDNAVGLNIRSQSSGEDRLFFFSPWKEHTMIGTWYSTTDDPTLNKISEEELQQFLDDINSSLVTPGLAQEDVSNIHIGFLPADQSAERSDAPPDTHLLKSYQLKNWSEEAGIRNLYTFRGTKYTLARTDATEVIDQLVTAIDRDIPASRSHVLPIYQTTSLPENTHSLSDTIIDRLMIDYGADINTIFDIIDNRPDTTAVIPGTSDHIKAEVYYAVDHEQAMTLTDLLKRRLDTGDRSPPEITTAENCADIMQKVLGWTDDEKNSQIKNLFMSYSDTLIQA